MNELLRKNPIKHCMLWVMLYVGLVNLGDYLSGLFGIGHLATGILLGGMSLMVLHYIRKSGFQSLYGLKLPEKETVRTVGWYIPLLVIGGTQLYRGVDPAMPSREILLVSLMMVLVGFLEEILFRGFLYQAILKRSGVKRAVMISGATFGIGHMMNLFRGYTLEALGLQIVVAISVGIMLAILVEVTKSLIPGIIFHILFNISGSVTSMEKSQEWILALFIILASLLYSVSLYRIHSRNKGTLQGNQKISNPYEKA